MGQYFPMIVTNVYKMESDITINFVTYKSKKEDSIMLQLQANAFDICRITKLLVKYNIRASITDSVITLDDDVSNELLTRLCTSMDKSAVQKGTPFIKSKKRSKTKVVKEPKKIVTKKNFPALSHYPSKYDLIYFKVKRGEVYLCDFGEPYGSEQGFIRYAIVIQNDDGNLHSPTTIVIACTTAHKGILPVHLHCTFSSKNMLDYDLARVGSAENVILAEQIQTVDKTRLRKYIGTLTPELMKQIEEKINVSLHLNGEDKKVYGDRPVSQKKARKELKDVNIVQVKLLSFVDINELFKIPQSYSTYEVRAQKILELFGFDFNKNGVQYLLKAIILAPKDVYFDLETLSERVSQSEGINKEEIKRLIIARVKERFGFQKSPTIDFIRLVSIFLVDSVI